MSNAHFLRPPKYRRHKAKNLAVVTLNGRDIYLGTYGTAKSKEQYQRLISEWLQNNGQLPPDRRKDITVLEVMAAYVAFAKGYYRKAGKVTREYELIRESCRIIKPLYASCRAVDFGPLALKVVRQAMIDRDWSRKYINKNIGRIVRMFKWAAGEELVLASVPQTLSMVTGLRRGRCGAKELPPVLPVDDETVNNTLEYLPDIVGDMVRLQRLTGCRPEEVCCLRPCDLDRTGDVWTYRPQSHKTEHHGKSRTIYIGPLAQEVLLRYLARDSLTYCFRPCDSEAKRLVEQEVNRKTPRSCGNVRGSNQKRNPKRQPGDQYTTGSYRRAIHRACDKAFAHPILGYVMRSSFTEYQQTELREWQSEHRWSPNRLRHTAATEIRREFGLEAAQVILGHSAADVTQIYAERDNAKGLEVARLIG